MSFQQIAKYRACQEEEDGRTEDLLLNFFSFTRKSEIRQAMPLSCTKVISHSPQTTLACRVTVQVATSFRVCHGKLAMQ